MPPYCGFSVHELVGVVADVDVGVDVGVSFGVDVRVDVGVDIEVDVGVSVGVDVRIDVVVLQDTKTRAAAMKQVSTRQIAPLFILISFPNQLSYRTINCF